MKSEDDKILSEEERFEQEKKDGFYQPDSNPENQAEAIRQSGLAYGAVTTLVGAILLFLAIGWAAHVLWDVGWHFGESVAFVPSFYPPVCIGFDLVVAIYIFWRFYDR